LRNQRKKRKNRDLLLRQDRRTATKEDKKGIKITLDSIAVNLHIRGNNIDAFEQNARQLNAGYLALGVECDNFAARRLYKNSGWSIVYKNPEKNTANYSKMIADFDKYLGLC
jgi:hypothetical protein